MTNPMDALISLQAALDDGLVKLQKCVRHTDLGVLLDSPTGTPRFTYAKTNGKRVDAIALFALTAPIDGVPCFQVGYAVREAMRGNGLGAQVLEHAIEELQLGLSRTPMKEFYLEAVVATDNLASNKIAQRVLTPSPETGTDSASKTPIFQYVRKIQTGK
jgi:hypothetical protein